ncbi:TPA: peptide ABC transporter permease [Candidatus Sumerlaeota bacterium]|nr:peptide ABC transporter permease [Candidatus Sumerlaeota bacterium]
MHRLHYFFKRLLLIIPTFLGITLVCFTLIQFVPGGPVEQTLMRMRGNGMGGEGGRGARSDAGTISPEQLKAIHERFGFDKPIMARYWKYLWTDRLGLKSLSFKFPNKTVWQLIAERLPVSLIFGVTGFLLSYIVCVPLGITKALRNGTSFDAATSVLVFVGYSIPGFALGMLLKMLLCGTVEGMPDWLPHAGFASDQYALLGFWGKVWDRILHMILPVTCYMVGNFAVLTLLMKNSLLEEVSKDYIRTARAKGCTVSRAIWVHALRNSLIPIATGFGGILTVMFAGSVLIEQVFEIPGIGRLSMEAIVGRDYPVFMGILTLTSILGLLGNILSDFCYVLIDPRIDLSK